MISTMGTAESGMLNEWITRGRAGEPGVAYFEWSLAPGLDAHDPVKLGIPPRAWAHDHLGRPRSRARHAAPSDMGTRLHEPSHRSR